MRVTEITYSRGQTRQLDAYEPVNIHFSAKAELEEGEDTGKSFIILKALVDKEVAIQDTFITEPQKVIRAVARQVVDKADKKSPF